MRVKLYRFRKARDRLKHLNCCFVALRWEYFFQFLVKAEIIEDHLWCSSRHVLLIKQIFIDQFLCQVLALRVTLMKIFFVNRCIVLRPPHVSISLLTRETRKVSHHNFPSSWMVSLPIGSSNRAHSMPRWFIESSASMTLICRVYYFNVRCCMSFH